MTLKNLWDFSLAPVIPRSGKGKRGGKLNSMILLALPFLLLSQFLSAKGGAAVGIFMYKPKYLLGSV